MKPNRSCALLLALACVAVQAMTQGYVEHDAQARELLSSVDWEKAAVVEVALDDFSFAPQVIELERHRPTVLRLKNVGTQMHDMSGGNFFQVALIRQVSIGAGRVVTPYIQSIQIRPKQQAEIWLLPVRTGTYSFQCNVAGHLERGMEGQVKVR